MAEEYKEISELVDEAKLSKHNVSLQELNNSILNLTKLLNDMFAMFKTASEQMKLEEKDSQDIYDTISSKLDEIIEQNRTIATGMVALSEIVKERPGDIKLQQPPQQLPPQQFQKPQQPVWPAPPIQMFPQTRQPIQVQSQGTPQISMPHFPPLNQQPTLPPAPPPIQGPFDDFSAPPSDLEMPDINAPFPFEEEKKSKGIFGRFRK